jgi:hypothetical protein
VRSDRSRVEPDCAAFGHETHEFAKRSRPLA